MKPEKIMDAINKLPDELLAEAAPADKKTPVRRFSYGRLALLCAMLAAVVAVGALLILNRPNSLIPKAKAQELAAPVYPQYPQWEDYRSDSETVREQWRKYHEDQQVLWQKGKTALPACYPFFSDMITTLLSEDSTQNTVMSPLNIFMATAMLGEVTNGESRQEILNALGAKDTAALREQAKNIWQLCYEDNGVEKTILGNSVWLSDEFDYNKDTTDILAGDYFASVFRGEMGSEEYTALLKEWLNRQTGGLLKDKIDKLETLPGTPLRLLSTVFYQTKWATEFLESNNRQQVFHSPGGDKEVTFLHADDYLRTYYYGDHFIAVMIPTFQEPVWLFLPDEGLTLEDLLKDEAFLAFINEPFDERNYYEIKADSITLKSYKGITPVRTKVNLSLPKFDFSCEQDLLEALKKMGITSCLDAEKADFSPLLKMGGAYLADARGSSRISLDEKGVTAASYVDYTSGAALPPEEEVDIVFDRPFLFLINAKGGIPLFAGLVNEP